MKPDPVNNSRGPGERTWGEEDGRVGLRHISLGEVIRKVFNLWPEQVRGPAWLEGEFYEIQPNAPADAPKVQIPLMMQSLLRDRFQLRFHWEPYRMRAYAMTIAEGGPNLPTASPQRVDTVPAPPAGTSAKSNGAKSKGLINEQEGNIGTSDGNGKFGRFTLRMKEGVLQSEFQSIRMTELAEYLSQGQLDAPVFDETGLAGYFKVPLEFMPRSLASQAEFRGPSLEDALKKLGLKLVSQQRPVQRMVIDRIEKVPTPN